MFFIKKIKKINQERIETAIADFEKSVDFEFIPVIAQKSSYVEHIIWMISLIILVLLMGCIETLFQTYMSDSWMPHWPFYAAAPFISFLIGYLLDKSDRIDRFFISKKSRAKQVQDKADLFFYERRLHELKSNQALLLYVSVMERQIILKPDPRLQFDGLQELTNELLVVLQDSFKKSDFEGGILNSITHLKKTLEIRFKKTQISDNIVPNKLIWLDE